MLQLQLLIVYADVAVGSTEIDPAAGWREQLAKSPKDTASNVNETHFLIDPRIKCVERSGQNVVERSGIANNTAHGFNPFLQVSRSRSLPSLPVLPVSSTHVSNVADYHDERMSDKDQDDALESLESVGAMPIGSLESDSDATEGSDDGSNTVSISTNDLILQWGLMPTQQESISTPTVPKTTPKPPGLFRKHSGTSRQSSPTERLQLARLIEAEREKQRLEVKQLVEKHATAVASWMLDEADHPVAQTIASPSISIVSSSTMSMRAMEQSVIKHRNELRFLAGQHRSQLRQLRRQWREGLLHPSAQNNTTTTTTTTATATIAATVISECEDAEDNDHTTTIPLPYVTPIRHQQALKEEAQATILYWGQWLSEEEASIIMRHHLQPGKNQPIPGMIRWELQPHIRQDMSGPALGQTLLRDLFLNFPPRTFSMPDGPLTMIVQQVLLRLLEHDPNFIGLQTRRQILQDYQGLLQRGYWKWRENPVQMEELLSDMLEGSSSSSASASSPETTTAAIWAGSAYFPGAPHRIPFQDYATGAEWIKRIMPQRIAYANGEVISLEGLRALYTEGLRTGGECWYDALHVYIRRATLNDYATYSSFLSLLATSSRNTSVAQNTICALRNFRALSQGCRPSGGAYPHSSLTNYLGGVLGVPTGPKVSAFLSNLVDPSASPAVTVDTHMERLVLGKGRLGLATYEYAAVEDLLRCAARECGATAPHRFQAAVWTAAVGPVSFLTELQTYVVTETFILPSAEGRHLLPSVSALPAGHLAVAQRALRQLETAPTTESEALWQQAVTCIQRQLLRAGYLNIYVEDDSHVMQRKITLRLLAPLRRENAASIKNRLANRRSFQSRRRDQSSNPWIQAAEDEEADQAQQTLDELKQAEAHTMLHQDDRLWYERDMRALRCWLLEETAAATLADCDYTPQAEHDPYYGTHVFFDGSEAMLPQLFPPGGFYQQWLSTATEPL